MLKKLLISGVLCAALLASGMPAAAAETVVEAETSAAAADDLLIKGMALSEDEDYGSIHIWVSVEDFGELGYEFGDSVNIRFSNGYELNGIPYFNGYYGRPGLILLKGKRGREYVEVVINYGDSLWETAGLSETDTAQISLCEKGTFRDIQEASDVEYTDDRSDYESDEVFGNFRNIRTGDLREDILYRGASPCSNKHNRAHYVDRLAADAGIAFILDLADNEKDIAGFMKQDDYDSPYFTSLYEAGKVALLSLTVNYMSDRSREGLISGLKIMAQNEGPYLVNCEEGKDRTGFACMLLEALTGSSYDEMINDYMITFRNYYGITEETEPVKYRTIINNGIVPMMAFMTGVDEAVLAESPETVDFRAGAESFLREGGMSEEEIAQLKERLCK